MPQDWVGSALMTVSAELVLRSGDRKGELVEFSRRRRFDRAFREAFARRFGEVDTVDEEQFINFLDFFALQHRLPDGRTIVEHFVAEHPQLPEEERAMLLSWRDVVEGNFRVQRRDRDALVTVNLVDELNYRVRSNRGPAALASMRRGSFVIARLVPIGEEWLLSGASTVWPAASPGEAYRLAAELAMRHPELVFRNPEKLAQGQERQREERRHFIAFFGSDLVVLSGEELAARMEAYWRFRMHEVCDAEGRSAADHTRERYGAAAQVPGFSLPLELGDEDTVGVVYDEVEGMYFWADFGLVQNTFASPALAARRRHRDAVLGYLEAPTISPLAFRRLAEPDPERASRVFRRVLRRPGFSWERDGEALLRRYKAGWFERPVLPSVTPISRALSDHYGESDGRTGAESEADRRPNGTGA
jgi:hypothetical protein